MNKLAAQFISLLVAISAILFQGASVIPQTGGVARYVYDDNGRLHAVITPDSMAAIYEYDAAGNFTQVRRTATNALEIIDIAPKKGAPGTQVSIWGVGFGSGTATVSFNGTTAQVIQSSSTFLIAAVPSNADTGPVTVTTPNGNVASPVPFQVLRDLSVLGPNASTVDSNTLSYTVPPGSNRILAVIASHADSAGKNFTGVTFGGHLMTLAGFETDGQVAIDSIWYIALGTSNTSTSGVITAIPPAGEEPAHFLAAQAFEDVDQTTPMSHSQSEQIPAMTNVGSTLNVVSAKGNLVLDVFDVFKAGIVVTRTPGAGQTLLHQGDAVISKPPSTYSGTGCYSTSIKAGAASTVMSWTSNGVSMIHLAVNINSVGQVAAVSPSTKSQFSIGKNVR